MLKPAIGAGPGLAAFFWFRGRTVSHRLVDIGIGTDVVAPLGANVALGVRVGAGFGAGASAGAAFGFGDGLGFG